MAIKSEQIAEALMAKGGNLSAVAEALGVTRQAISKRVNGSQELQRVRDEAETKVLDLAEGQLITAIKVGDPWAIRLYLTTKGKGRGYTTRNETTVPPGGLPPALVLDAAQLAEMTDEEIDRLEQNIERLERGADSGPGGEAAPAREDEYAGTIATDEGDVAS